MHRPANRLYAAEKSTAYAPQSIIGATLRPSSGAHGQFSADELAVVARFLDSAATAMQTVRDSS